MKTRLAALVLALVVILATPILALAQDPPPDPVQTVTIFGKTIEVTTLDGIAFLLSGGLVTLIVQFLKKKIKVFATGVGAFFFTVLSTFIVTGAYFLFLHPMNPWDWIKFLICGAAVLGESTGWFHLYKKASGTPSTP